MTYADMFSKVKGLFMESDVSDISEHLAFQFNITGEAEGIFYAEVKDGVLAVEPYEYFDRDAIFICSAETLFKLADGKIDPHSADKFGLHYYTAKQALHFHPAPHREWHGAG